MTITVTQEDIDGGKPRDCERCPVAIALLRHTGRKVEVGSYKIMLWDGVLKTFLETPEAVGEWMANYDQDYTVHPITFELGV